MEDLLKQFKKKSIKNVLPVTIILTIAAVILFLINGAAVPQLFSMFFGGINLDDIPSTRLYNTIASSEISAVYDCFAEYESSDGQIYEYYIIPYGEEWEKYIGVRVKESKAPDLDRICDDTWEYLMGNEEITLDNTVLVKGNVRLMDYEESKYFKEWFRDMEFTDDEIEDCVVEYVLVDDRFADDISPLRLYLMCGVGIIIFLIGVWAFIKACLGLYLKDIKKDFAQLGAYAEGQIVSDYENACTFGKGIRIGRPFTYNTASTSPRAYLNNNIAWLYQHRTKNYTNGLYTGSNYSLVLYPVNGDGKVADSFDIKKKDKDRILEYYANNFPHMVVGFSEELRDLYHRDRGAFLALRYAQAQTDAFGQIPLQGDGFGQTQNSEFGQASPQNNDFTPMP